MSKLDKEINEIEQGDAWNETDEVVDIQITKPLDKVIPVRLPSEVWERLRKEASELGVGPTTLARMWILERLNQKTNTQDVVTHTAERIIEEWKRQLNIISRDKDSQNRYNPESEKES